MDNYNRHLEEF